MVMVLALSVLWIFVDQSGKAEWREVQERLRAKGEATTIEELNLRTRDEVPDEENFCTIPWLMANEDGTESAAMKELAAQLSFVAGSAYEPRLIVRALGKPAFGFPGNISTLAETLKLALEEKAIEPDQTMLAEARDDHAAQVLALLNGATEFWGAAEEARLRPHAIWLPTFREMAQNRTETLLEIRLPGGPEATMLFRALSIRTVAAAHAGDIETALRSLEVSQRLWEAYSHEPTMLATVVTHAAFANTIDSVTECLWTEEFQTDDAALKRLALIFTKWDMMAMVSRTVRGELIVHCDMIESNADRRGEMLAAVFLTRTKYSSPVPEFLYLAPRGWFAANAALSADRFDRTLLDGIRRADFPIFFQGVSQLDTELRSQSVPQRFNRCFSALNLPIYVTVLQTVGYVEAMRRQILIACALYRYRLAKNGMFPSTLDELVPEFLDEVLVDPVDGAPMRYSKTNDGSFFLYSVGMDGSDNGGKLNLDPDRQERTRVQRQRYVGDWPWPVTPRETVEVEP